MSAVPEKRPFERGKAGMNTSAERIVEHVEINIRRPLPQVRGGTPRPVPMVIACGGPSLAEDWDDLEALVKDGAKLCTMNGTHNYCVGRGLTPNIHVQVDARPFNTRFVQPPQDKTLYCMASQCHPSAFDALEGHRVAIYHCDTGSGEKEVLDDYYFKHWAFVEGGSTVALRTISLSRMLGFTKLEIFGFDSCFIGDDHHAYEQTENDLAPRETVTVDGREFTCHSWMVEQAVDFMGLMKARAMFFEDIRVHGDGLIAALMKHGCDKQLEKEHGTEDRRDADAA